MKFHHVGIIVKNIKSSLPQIMKILNAKKVSKVYLDNIWKIKLIFIKHKNKITFEIIQPTSKKSPISNALDQNINILNHVAYTSKNFISDKKVIIDNGGIPVTEAKKAKAFGGKKIQFFITKDKFLIELIEN